MPAQLNNDYGRELLMQAIQGNCSAIDQIASALNCSTTQLQNAICNVQGAIDKVAGQVGMTSQAVINAVQQQGCEIGNQISSCCCNLSSLINQSTCQTQGMITQQGFDNQLRTLEQTNILHMITKQDIQAAASYIFRSSFVSEDQARKVTIRAGNNATKNLVKTFRGKLFKKAFGRARRGKDISSFERQEKESGFNFLYNPNNGRMRSGHIIIDGIGLFKQIIESGT